MHKAVTLVKVCYYEFNEISLSLRVDLDHRFVEDISLITKESYKIIYRIKDNGIESTLPSSAMFVDVLEVEIPFDAFDVKGNGRVDIWFSLKIKDMVIDRSEKGIHFRQDSVRDTRDGDVVRLKTTTNDRITKLKDAKKFL